MDVTEGRHVDDESIHSIQASLCNMHYVMLIPNNVNWILIDYLMTFQ